MAQTTAERRRGAENNLELATDKPNLSLMLAQLERAEQGRMADFLNRNRIALRWWNSRWDGQTNDGRRHAYNGEDAFPWEGATDSRIRTVKEQIRDHVMLMKAAFNGAKVQASTIRPLAPGMGRRSNHVTSLLKWQTDVQMRAELQREIPLAFAWTAGYGAAVIEPVWEQSRRLDHHDLTVPILADAIAVRDQLEQAEADQLFLQLQAAFGDPAQEEALIALVQALILDINGTPVLSRSEARRAVRQIGQERRAPIAVPYVFASKPRWTALRIGLDVVFHDITGDLQQEPFIARYERVSETTLRDRIVTDDYDSGFVDDALEHFGPADGFVRQANRERLEYADGFGYDAEAEAHGLDLVHCYYKTTDKGTPCLYRTVFAPALVRGVNNRRRLAADDLSYAKHGMHEYEHGEYPFIPLRFEKDHRPVTSSQGIAEHAYTWEIEIKAQADGLADRTTLVNRPPLIVPYSRVHAIKGSPIPGSILGVTKPQELQWMPLPQSDGTPVQVMRQVMERVENYFGIFGANVDPDKKVLRRQEIADDTLGALTLVLKQTYQLDLQYMTDEEVASIVGPLETPWKASGEAIRELHEISATYNARMLDKEYAGQQLDMLGKMMGFNQGGAGNVNRVFRIAAELVAPDVADEIVDTDQVATERERRDEQQAIAQMLVGMEPDKPQSANHQLRLQTIQETMQNPKLLQQIMSDPDKLELFKNRIEFHQNQIQQYGENPGIGRALSTQTFDKSKAPVMSLAGA